MSERMFEAVNRYWDEKLWLFFTTRGAEYVKQEGRWRRLHFGTYARAFWNVRDKRYAVATVSLLLGGLEGDALEALLDSWEEWVSTYVGFLRLVQRFFDKSSFSEEEESALVSFFQKVLWPWPLNPWAPARGVFFFPGVLDKKRGLFAVMENEVQAVVVELMMKLVFRWNTEARLCPICGKAHFGKSQECGRCRAKRRKYPKVLAFRNLLYQHKHRAKKKGQEKLVKRIEERLKDIERGRPLSTLVREHLADCKTYDLPTNWARNYEF